MLPHDDTDESAEVLICEWRIAARELSTRCHPLNLG